MNESKKATKVIYEKFGHYPHAIDAASKWRRRQHREKMWEQQVTNLLSEIAICDKALETFDADHPERPEVEVKLAALRQKIADTEAKLDGPKGPRPRE